MDPRDLKEELITIKQLMSDQLSDLKALDAAITKGEVPHPDGFEADYEHPDGIQLLFAWEIGSSHLLVAVTIAGPAYIVETNEGAVDISYDFEDLSDFATNINQILKGE